MNAQDKAFWERYDAATPRRNLTVYDDLSAHGYEVENAPRANPGAKLNEPYVLRHVKSGKIVLRGFSRDNLESKLRAFYRGLVAAEEAADYARHYGGAL
jgi:hypothetical protein